MVYEKFLSENSSSIPTFWRAIRQFIAAILQMILQSSRYRRVFTRIFVRRSAFAAAAPIGPFRIRPSAAVAIAAAARPGLAPQRGLGRFAARQNSGEFMVRIYHNL